MSEELNEKINMVREHGHVVILHGITKFDSSLFSGDDSIT